MNADVDKNKDVSFNVTIIGIFIFCLWYHSEVDVFFQERSHVFLDESWNLNVYIYHNESL